MENWSIKTYKQQDIETITTLHTQKVTSLQQTTYLTENLNTQQINQASNLGILSTDYKSET